MRDNPEKHENIEWVRFVEIDASNPRESRGKKREQNNNQTAKDGEMVIRE